MDVEDMSELSFITDAGSTSGDVTHAAQPPRHWADPYIFAACAGAIGALSVLFAGCVSKLVVVSFRGDENEFNSVISYVFIAGMILCVLAQTHLLNRAMIEGDAMSVLPVFMAFWTSGSVVSGLIFYQQGTKGAHWVVFGLLCMCFGVLLLIQHERLHKAYQDDEGFDSAAASRRFSSLGVSSIGEATPQPERGTSFALSTFSNQLGQSHPMPPMHHSSFSPEQRREL